MKKNECVETYKRIFKHQKIKKVIPFRSPNDGNVFQLEKVNPDHVGIIWGRTKRKPSTVIKFAKVFFAVFPISYGLIVSSWLDYYTGYAYNIMCNIGLGTLISSVMVASLYYISIIILAGGEKKRILAG